MKKELKPKKIEDFGKFTKARERTTAFPSPVVHCDLPSRGLALASFSVKERERGISLAGDLPNMEEQVEPLPKQVTR